MPPPPRPRLPPRPKAPVFQTTTALFPFVGDRDNKNTFGKRSALRFLFFEDKKDKKDKLFCLLLFFLSSNFNDNIDNNVLPQAREAHVALPYVV